MRAKMSHYYHAGAGSPPDVYWSDRLHRSRVAAEREALAIARRTRGRPLVEWWDRARGPDPGPEAVLGAEFVTPEEDEQ